MMQIDIIPGFYVKLPQGQRLVVHKVCFAANLLIQLLSGFVRTRLKT